MSWGITEKTTVPLFAVLGATIFISTVLISSLIWLFGKFAVIESAQASQMIQLNNSDKRFDRLVVAFKESRDETRGDIKELLERTTRIETLVIGIADKKQRR